MRSRIMNLEHFYKPALAAIRNHLQDNKQDKKIDKKYKSYAASFGATLRTSGVVAALGLYTDKESKGDRYKMLGIYNQVLNELYEDCNIKAPKKHDSLLKAVMEDAGSKEKLHRWKLRLETVSVAVKLAFRNIPHQDKENES